MVWPLTVGEEYECVEEQYDRDLYRIRINSKFTWWFESKRFITLEEYRSKRLKEIGI
ncbi:MAG: hypothetical protein PHY08_12790 [Candidatus Cloacimonetes bacterium]|nr:hypothetical protein [Candidatus Cloacimonadota bacterium]